MSGALCALGITTGLLGLIEPVFRPVALVPFGLGIAVAGVLAWRSRRNQHPSVAPWSGGDEERLK